MTQFIAKMALITGIAVSITGCAQMSFVGDSLWGFTKSTANFVTSPVTSLLRPAPYQDYVFEHEPTSYQNTSKHQYSAQRPLNNYQATQYKVGAYKTANTQYKHAYRDIVKPMPAKLIPRIIVQEPYKPTLKAQLDSNANQDISFVKIGGGSNMADWESCQQQAGSYFQITQTSYRIDPKFEHCMRGKGYKPESEAKAELNL